MIHWWKNQRGYWDQTFLADLLLSAPQEKTFFVIPGAYANPEEVFSVLDRHDTGTVIFTSDEEGVFPYEKLAPYHRFVFFRQYAVEPPCLWFPVGYTPHIRQYLQEHDLPKKEYESVFLGQINTPIRKDIAKLHLEVKNSLTLATCGFSLGVPPLVYADLLAKGVYAPSPPGHVSFDTFRFYEALEVLAVPILYDKEQYKNAFSFYCPFVSFCEEDPFTVFAFWLNAKYRIQKTLFSQKNHQVTCILTTSPIPSHPSTKIIEETILSLQYFPFPIEKILVCFDGGEEASYKEYKTRCLWLFNTWKIQKPTIPPIVPIFSSSHVHQTKMIQKALLAVDTPYILFCEHDTPFIRPVPPIPLHRLPTCFCLRFHFEKTIPKDHEYLMDEYAFPFLKTRQFSARPHLATKSWYDRAMTYFSSDPFCYFEDGIYTHVEKNPDALPLFIYAPSANLQYTTHTNGRQGAKKHDDAQRF